MSTHREEALKAIKEVEETLAASGPMNGLVWRKVQATLKYATEEVLAIQEVKRVRKAKATEGS